MLKLTLVVLWLCICFPPVKPCGYCLISIFCTNNGLVFDGESNQACIILREADKIYSHAQFRCRSLTKSANLWKPSNSLTKLLSAQRPELRNGEKTYTWTSGKKKKAAVISGNGTTVKRLNRKFVKGKKVRTICCVRRLANKFSRPGFSQDLSDNIERVAPDAKNNVNTDFCPITSQTSGTTIRTSASVFETNSEMRSNPVSNLFNFNKKKEYKSSLSSSRIHVIQFFSSNESLTEIVLRSNTNTPPEFELYGGTEFRGESNISGDYDFIGDQFDDHDQSPEVFRMLLEPGNCYNLIILYIVIVTEQISIHEFSARSLSNGRPSEEKQPDCPNGYDSVGGLCLSINCNKIYNTTVEGDASCQESSGRAATFDEPYQFAFIQQYLTNKQQEGCNCVWYGWRNPHPYSSNPRTWEFPVVDYQPFSDFDFTGPFWDEGEPSGRYHSVIGVRDTEFRGRLINEAYNYYQYPTSDYSEEESLKINVLCRYYFNKAPNPQWNPVLTTPKYFV